MSTTNEAVNDLLRRDPTSRVEYYTMPGVTHDPALYASQRLWLDWIAARFAGEELKPGLSRSKASDFPRPLSSYQSDANWVITPTAEPFQRA